MLTRFSSFCVATGCLLPLVGACKKTDDSGALGASGTSASGGSAGIVIGQGGSAGTISSSGGTAGSGDASGGTGGSVASDGGEGGETGAVCQTLVGLGQCGGTRVEAMPVPVNVLFVIDKSGSMTDQPVGFSTDKWAAMKQALGSALSTAPATLNVGLLLYPYSTMNKIPLYCEGDLCCEVPDASDAIRVGVGSDQGTPIEQALSDASPGGGTPTAAALARALDYFTTGDGLLLEGDKYVLLATDGGPNCNYDLTCSADTCTPNLDGEDQCQAGNCCDGAGEYCVDDEGVTGQIDALRAAGIATFVVGIPGTEDYTDYLDAFARAGGVPQQGSDHDYFAVSAASGVSGLTDVLRNITTELVRSCEIALGEPPAQLSLVNVAIDCEVLHKEGDESGWDFDDSAAPTSVIIHGPACDDLKANGARRVNVVYGCTTIR